MECLNKIIELVLTHTFYPLRSWLLKREFFKELARSMDESESRRLYSEMINDLKKALEIKELRLNETDKYKNEIEVKYRNLHAELSQHLEVRDKLFSLCDRFDGITKSLLQQVARYKLFYYLLKYSFLKRPNLSDSVVNALWELCVFDLAAEEIEVLSNVTAEKINEPQDSTKTIIRRLAAARLATNKS